MIGSDAILNIPVDADELLAYKLPPDPTVNPRGDRLPSSLENRPRRLGTARLFLMAAVVIGLIVSLLASAQMRVDAVSTQTKSAGIQWSTARRADSDIDAAALKSIYSDMAQEPNHDLKGIVIVRDGRYPLSHEERHIVTNGHCNSEGPGPECRRPDLALPGLPKDGKEKITIHVRDEALIQLERLATQTRNEVRILYVRTKTIVAAMNTPKT